MLCADHLKLVLVCLLLPSGGVGENGFNCEDECGMYTKNDRVAPLLHESCTAMTESEKCKRKFTDNEKRKRSRRKKSQSERIVGGEVAKDAMPWMVKPLIVNMQKLVLELLMLSRSECKIFLIERSESRKHCKIETGFVGGFEGKSRKI